MRTGKVKAMVFTAAYAYDAPAIRDVLATSQLMRTRSVSSLIQSGTVSLPMHHRSRRSVFRFVLMLNARELN